MSKSVLSAASNLDIAGLGKAILADLTALKTRITTLLADVTAIRANTLTGMLAPATLAIKAGGSAIVKSSSLFMAKANGTLVYKAANTDMSAIAGTLATAKAAAWAFYIDSEGTITTSTKTADVADLAAAFAALPAPPAGKAQIGVVIVANATGSNFVAGTTALDTGSLTVTYINNVGNVAVPAALTTSAAATLETID